MEDGIEVAAVKGDRERENTTDPQHDRKQEKTRDLFPSEKKRDGKVKKRSLSQKGVHENVKARRWKRAAKTRKAEIKREKEKYRDKKGRAGVEEKDRTETETDEQREEARSKKRKDIYATRVRARKKRETERYQREAATPIF